MAAFLLHRPRRHDMNQMEIFKNPEFGSIRTFEQDGKVLFCGKDVAQALGYRRPADAIAAHCKGVCVLPTPSNGGIQQMKFIPEGDVYRLIVHSKLSCPASASTELTSPEKSCGRSPPPRRRC